MLNRIYGLIGIEKTRNDKRMRICTRVLVAEPTNAFRCTYLLNRLGACGAFLKPEEILLDFFRLFPIFWCAVAILPSTNTVRIVGEETMLSRRPDSWFVVETFSGEGNPTRKVSLVSRKWNVLIFNTYVIIDPKPAFDFRI